jgi:hypothetical protein
MAQYVNALVFNNDGNLYIGGGFNSAGGVANTANLCMWNGTTFVSVSTQINDPVVALAFSKNGDLYIGGTFTIAGGSISNYIAMFDGTTRHALSTGLSLTVYDIICDNNGDVFIGGDFTNAGDANGDYISRWNGVQFNSLGSGMNSRVNAFMFDKNGNLYIGGTFTTANGVTLPDRICIWKNNTFFPLDVNVQDVSAYIYSIVENKNTGTLYFGGIWAGTDALSATVTVPNVLGSDTYPILYLTGPGLIYQVKNYTTGQAIYFDNFTLLAGESVKIDLRPGKKTFISSYRGNIGRYVLDGSDIDFKLIPGNNNVSVLITGGTAATTASMVWQANYNSIDEANYDS